MFYKLRRRSRAFRPRRILPDAAIDPRSTEKGRGWKTHCLIIQAARVGRGVNVHFILCREAVRYDPLVFDAVGQRVCDTASPIVYAPKSKVKCEQVWLHHQFWVDLQREVLGEDGVWSHARRGRCAGQSIVVWW